MGASRSPLVSVVIPVFNGQSVIEGTISSVLAQTYDNFELVIANNRSTDGTASIVEEFAARDRRVRLWNATEFVDVVESHNRAFTLISDEAEYCKVVGDDDWLFPSCLEETVRVAQAYSSVAVVGSYVLRGLRMPVDGLPFPDTFATGRDVCRRFLLYGEYPFAGAAPLLRADIVRERRPFYHPRRYHGDTDAYLDILRRYDFGFVHQVLSGQRRRDQSQTTRYLERMHAFQAQMLDLVNRFGPIYLTPDEQRERLAAAEHGYYKMLAASVFEFREPAFWDFHRHFFDGLGYAPSRLRIAEQAGLRLVEAALNPLRTTQQVMTHVKRRRRRETASAGEGPAVVLRSAQAAHGRSVPSNGRMPV